MSGWHDLYATHTKGRAVSDDLERELRKRLVELARREHCAATIQGRFAATKAGGAIDLFIRGPSSSPQPEPLQGLPTLKAATLTLMAKLDARRKRLHQFTAMVEGTTQTGAAWASAIHLEDDRADDRRGSGACGHAAFHCHVGPTLDDEPKVRVPLPGIGPAEALDWLLTAILPDWEPAPWPPAAPVVPR